MRNTYPRNVRAVPLIALAMLGSGSAFAATTFNGTPGLDIGTAANWSNGLPGSGNDGTIATAGTLDTITISGGGTANVTHSSGTITVVNGSLDSNISTSSTTLNWNQTGGTMTAGTSGGIRQFFINGGVTYNMSGGTIDFGTTGGSRLIVRNGGSFLMTGGTLQDGGIQNQGSGSTMTLNGGTYANLSRGIQITTGSTINIGGNFSITSTAAGVTQATFLQESGNSDSGSLIFSNTWTGFFTDPGTSTWTATEWTAAFTGVDGTSTNSVFVGATQVTAGNFGNFFQVAANGNLSMIPEPSVALLGAMGALGMLRRRRR